MKEGWSLHTVNRNLLRSTLLDFNKWLQEKAEAHGRMRTISKKASAEEQTSLGSKKTTSKVIASTTEQRKTTKVSTSQESRKSVICLVCKANLPLWRCTVFEKNTQTQRAKLLAGNQLCFSCFQANHSFHNCCTMLNAYFPANRGVRSQLVLTLVSI